MIIRVCIRTAKNNGKMMYACMYVWDFPKQGNV